MAAEFFHNLLLNIFMGLLKFQKQPRFGRWVRLEEQKNKILRAVEESSDEFPNHLFDFLSTALYLPSHYFRRADWTKIVLALYKSLTKLSYKIDLALFEPTKEDKKDDSVSWNYDGRAWHLYAHMIAGKYGWLVEYISNLRLPVVLPLIQEILLEDQLTKEFQWSMSERSSYYDDKAKVSKANPLPRPNWMNKHIDPAKELRVTQIPVGMMPMGQGLTVEQVIASQKT
jgi:hypothetical protein